MRLPQSGEKLSNHSAGLMQGDLLFCVVIPIHVGDKLQEKHTEGQH